MTIPIYQVDAFTSKLFGGNPAAVCYLQQWLTENKMQEIAQENNLAETAFFLNDGDNYKIRWFTPKSEIDLCGHATLATAHILFTTLEYKKDVVQFETMSAGKLAVQKTQDKYTMDFPSRPAIHVEIPRGLSQALSNVEPIEILKSRDYLLVYESEQQIRDISPDFSALMNFDTLGVTVTAPGDHVDFVSRFFAPKVGIPEDPVTGSAHCSLIPYWANKLKKNKLHAYQLSNRRGELWCELKNDRVLMSGNAVTYLKGEIFV
jgi:PhzF family phenazine biosynthesis protein